MKSPLSGAECSLLNTIEVEYIRRRWLEAMNIVWDPKSSSQRVEYWLDSMSGFAFYTPTDLAGEAPLYEQLQEFDWYYMPDKWEFRQALAWIQALPCSQSLLEVGVGKGFFLQHARHAGLVPTGVELNPKAAASARALGFEVLMDPLDVIKQQLGEGNWDVICSFQVLEHLPNPLAFLADAAALLRANGALILSVPNGDVARQLDPQRERDLLDQPPHHMGHWSGEVFRYLPEVLPLRLEALAYEPLAPHHVEWFVASWSRQWRVALPRPLGRLVVNRWSQSLLQCCLQLGLRRFVRGHTLMAQFRKIG